mmetsp:Transcript_6362/g.16244  ORF Transcript_6362/g.16244 Transcript_6362/m.16244 type:complete len:165 (+) Transcript_6362:75-569(+)|eukprot:CAMPEP_0202042442 /NCGR_PEP_ID=MMETSP0962-20130828/27283_1 /ASSEMBLY_ACC=CAM_ASM_000488 /TAXON_ID=4773 /ORGANISM="Schizochytrium aggregatum, Strain ATCC28209" /LENGTH=164 /DNA_ID=CAMNT_0048606841 /DNA_START=89 /DNA_END=583 /DNA_ORIENTATION=+
MGKFIKQGKVVVVLNGRFAGRKAVVLKTFEDGSSTRKFQHMLVAGIDKGPKKVTKAMHKKKVENRTKIRPFVKMVNYNHVMPTRYQVDLDFKKIEMKKNKREEKAGTEPVVVTIDEEAVTDQSKRVQAKKAAKQVLQQGFWAQDKRKSTKAQEGVQFLYQKLRF